MAKTEITVPLTVRVEGAGLEGWTETTDIVDISQGRRMFHKSAGELSAQEKVLKLQEELARVRADLERALKVHRTGSCPLVQEVKEIIDGITG